MLFRSIKRLRDKQRSRDSSDCLRLHKHLQAADVTSAFLASFQMFFNGSRLHYGQRCTFGQVLLVIWHDNPLLRFFVEVNSVASRLMIENKSMVRENIDQFSRCKRWYFRHIAESACPQMYPYHPEIFRRASSYYGDTL